MHSDQLKVTLDHLVGSIVETNWTLCWENVMQRAKKMKRWKLFCIFRIVACFR